MSATLAIEPAAHQQDICEPNSAGGVWDYVSASRLNLWLRCPLAFKLKYIDGVREPTTPSLFLGRQVHQGLERFYRRRQLGLPTATSLIVEAMLADWQQAAELEGVQFASSQEATRLGELAATSGAGVLDAGAARRAAAAGGGNLAVLPADRSGYWRRPGPAAGGRDRPGAG